MGRRRADATEYWFKFGYQRTQVESRDRVDSQRHRAAEKEHDGPTSGWRGVRRFAASRGTVDRARDDVLLQHVILASRDYSDHGRGSLQGRQIQRLSAGETQQPME